PGGRGHPTAPGAARPARRARPSAGPPGPPGGGPPPVGLVASGVGAAGVLLATAIGLAGTAFLARGLPFDGADRAG
ncbi:hypothetical protein LCD36_24530, partial [Saccharopolyspora sp. 6T]|nr:hypothetical protein [Saccharopolyspora sp. 6T]